MVETRTPRYELPQWGDADTDAPDMADFNEAFLKLDAAPVDLQGTLATRPGPGVAGRYHWATDAGLLARDDGTAWQPVSAAPGSALPVVTSSAASLTGSAAAYAREDHRHGFNSGTPTTSAAGDAAAQGSASALARSDHRHGREAFGTPVASAPGDTTAPGVAATLARADHVHGREAAITVPTAGGATPRVVNVDAGVPGVAVAYSREDHAHQAQVDNPDAVTPGNTTSAGLSSRLSRADHRHAVPAFGSVGPVTTAADARNNGSATTFARADHVHGREGYGMPVASTPGEASAAGTATTVARSDHVHGRESQLVMSIADGKLASDLPGHYPNYSEPQNGIFYMTCTTANGWPLQGTVHTVKRADSYCFQDVVERPTTQALSPRRYYRAATSANNWGPFVQVA